MDHDVEVGGFATCAAMTSRVLIVRHGETDANVQGAFVWKIADIGILQGQMDTLLNGIGERQAQLTGAAMRTEVLTRMVSSPLKRTWATAAAIAAHHPDVPLESDVRLMERSFGVLEGQVYRGPSEKPADTEGIESPMAYVIVSWANTQTCTAHVLLLGRLDRACTDHAADRHCRESRRRNQRADELRDDAWWH